MESNKDLQFYTLPFSDDGGCGYIFDNKSNFAFMLVPNLSEQQVEKILVSLNSKDYNPLVYKQSFTLKYIKEIVTINMNDKPFIVIRGWENLTGKGAHNLSEEKAREIQDNLAEWIISKLQ
jgi:hypothetical protein